MAQPQFLPLPQKLLKLRRLRPRSPHLRQQRHLKLRLLQRHKLNSLPQHLLRLQLQKPRPLRTKQINSREFINAT